MNYFVMIEPKHADLPFLRTARNRGYKTAVVTTDPSQLRALPEDLACFNDDIDRVIEVPALEGAKEVLDRTQGALDGTGTIKAVLTSRDEYVDVLAEMRRLLGLRTCDPQLLRDVLDKSHLRKELVRLGYSKLTSFNDDEMAHLREWPFPAASAFLQTLRGAGSFGTREVSSLEELKMAKDELLHTAIPCPHLSRYIKSCTSFALEEKAHGKFHSVECILSGGQLYHFGFTAFLAAKHRSLLLRPAPWLTHTHPVLPPGGADIVKRIEAMLGELGFRDWIFHIELCIKDDGNFEIIDLNPRWIGAHCIWGQNIAWGMPTESLVIDWAADQFDPRRMPTMHQHLTQLQYFYGPDGGCTLHSIRRPETAWDCLLKPLGSVLPAEPLSGGWLGVFVVKGAIESELNAQTKQVLMDIRINDEYTVQF